MLDVLVVAMAGGEAGQADTPAAVALYHAEQRHSRHLQGRGAGLRRADIEQLRKP